jgi:hypothetical protein
VASRDGLLVLRRNGDPVELQTCDAFTGHDASLPPTTLPCAHFHVVLAVDHAERSFELLVADKPIRFYRTFSSKNRQWSATREVNITCPQYCDPYSSAVIRRTVYWPCYNYTGEKWNHILALDVDAGEAAMIKSPPGSSGHRLPMAPLRGLLCVLTEESSGIAMWTLTSSVAGTWSRQVVISKMEIARQAGLGASPSPTFDFEGFGERSGVVILNLFKNGCLLRLDLGMKEEASVVTWLSPPGNAEFVTDVFLHEIDMISLLQSMKHF